MEAHSKRKYLSPWNICDVKRNHTSFFPASHSPALWLNLYAVERRFAPRLASYVYIGIFVCISYRMRNRIWCKFHVSDSKSYFKHLLKTALVICFRLIPILLAWFLVLFPSPTHLLFISSLSRSLTVLPTKQSKRLLSSYNNLRFLVDSPYCIWCT